MSSDATVPARENASRPIRLTSHASGHGALPIRWAAATAADHGPVVGTTTLRSHRNVIGTHRGSYGIYCALAVASGALSARHKADLTNTPPTDIIGPYPQWSEPGRIVAMDPWGAAVADVFSNDLAAGYDTRPTIAVTQAHVILPEVARVNIPAGLIPADAQVEMDAKMATGYFTPGSVPGADELKKAKGRGLSVWRDATHTRRY